MLPGIQGGAAELHMGGATVSITPDEPVAISGQMRTRIARTVESAATATALALESREGDKVLDQAIFVSCDLVALKEDPRPVDSATHTLARSTQTLAFALQSLGGPLPHSSVVEADELPTFRG